MYLISGLAGGRLALYTKMHHAAIDGSSGTELLTVLVDLTPEREKQPVAVDFKPEPAPSDVTLLAGAAASLATRPVSAARIVAIGMQTGRPAGEVEINHQRGPTQRRERLGEPERQRRLAATALRRADNQHPLSRHRVPGQLRQSTVNLDLTPFSADRFAAGAVSGLASAWTKFLEAAEVARASGETEREQKARARAAQRFAA